MSNESHLRVRWNTQAGRTRLYAVRKALLEGKDWPSLLTGFPFVEEVEHGRDLRGADLSESVIPGANLQRAHLAGSTLSRSNLKKADLRRANLAGAKLTDAAFSDADMRWAVLGDTDMTKTKLRGANLSMADIQNADLSFSDVRGGRFVVANLDGACLSGAKLFGASLADWSISNVTCDHVYWDAKGKQRTPRDRDFEPGEFEALYSTPPTFKYYFENGLTPLDSVLMDGAVRAIKERRPDFQLRLDALDSRGRPHAVFSVFQEEMKEEARAEVEVEYEKRLASVAVERDTYMECFRRLADRPLLVEGDQIITTDHKGNIIIAREGATLSVSEEVSDGK